MVKGIQWLAMTVLVGPLLWLGGVLGPSRDRGPIRALVTQVCACLCPGPVMVAFDGLKTYIEAFQQVFRGPLRTGQRGRPRLVPWLDVAPVKVIKRYIRGCVTKIKRRIVQGLPTLVARLLIESQGGVLINTAYIERLNATFRQCLSWLTRPLAHRADTLLHATFLLGSVYTFCRCHTIPSFPDSVSRTPAMAAGLTDHPWSIFELLTFKVAPPPYVAPKRRGRKPKQVFLEAPA